jgi:predicted nuclease with TOPRIM domain
MVKVFSVLGLVISSASAVWLLMNEIREKQKIGDRLLKKKELSDRRKGLKADIKEIRENLAKAYAGVDPSGEKERQRFEENTKSRWADLKDVESQLEEINEAADDFEAAWPSRADIGGFGLLLLGFVLQLFAEIMKP